MSKSTKKKWYVVWAGRQPGIYTSWEVCQSQVQGYSGARFKSFDSLEMAQAAYAGDEVEVVQSGKVDQALVPSLAVDAACSGNPGVMEYRGVWVQSGEEAFRSPEFESGTNNIGEFLALVDGLRLLQRLKMDCPIYTDSHTALAWLRKKSVNTTLQPNASAQALFKAIQEAQSWLRENQYSTPIRKWDTRAWGEIPADFGRK